MKKKVKKKPKFKKIRAWGLVDAWDWDFVPWGIFFSLRQAKDELYYNPGCKIIKCWVTARA